MGGLLGRPEEAPLASATGLRAIVTDLDGVLCDTETLFVRGVNALLADEGLAPLAFGEARALVGLDNASWWRDLRDRRSLRLSLEEYTARVDAVSAWYFSRHLVPAPGAARLLTAARAGGLRVALASSADRPDVDRRLRLLDLPGGFDAIVTREDVENPKPHPEVYLAATRALKVPPAQALALEDSPVGLRAARAAGLFTVAVRTPWSQGLPLEEAHLVVDSLEGLDLDAVSALAAGRR